MGTQAACCTPCCAAPVRGKASTLPLTPQASALPLAQQVEPCAEVEKAVVAAPPSQPPPPEQRPAPKARRWVRCSAEGASPLSGPCDVPVKPFGAIGGGDIAGGGGADCFAPAVLVLEAEFSPPSERGSARSLRVRARRPSGEEVAEVEMRPDEDLKALRLALEARSGVRPERQRLSFGEGRCCRDFSEATTVRECFGLSSVEEKDDKTLARQGSGTSSLARQGTASSLRQRASTAITDLDDLDTHDNDTQPQNTREWSEDYFGTMVHKPTGIRVSPEKGIHVDGVDYRLSAEDVEVLDGRLLGSGASGVVHEGRLKATGAPVAVKTLKAGADSETREQLLKEIRGLVQAEGCPYLIQWFSGWVDLSTGSVNVVVEFMDRGSLADLRRRANGQKVPAERVACIAAQVIRGLHFLQLRGLLHRDVKPENILHSQDGRVKLTDFGISKELSATMNVGTTFVGTATYMAPERASGGAYSYESDIWSAGLVIYELAAGRYPFCAASFPELFEALCEGPEPRLEASTCALPALRELVSRCLTRDQTKRPDAMALRSQALVANFAEADLAAFAAWLAADVQQPS